MAARKSRRKKTAPGSVSDLVTYLRNHKPQFRYVSLNGERLGMDRKAIEPTTLRALANRHEHYRHSWRECHAPVWIDGVRFDCGASIPLHEDRELQISTTPPQGEILPVGPRVCTCGMRL